MTIKYTPIVLFFCFAISIQSQTKNNGEASRLAINITNTSLGYNAGNSGLSNTSIGYEAGDVVNGNSNTFIGSDSGKSTTFGAENVFVGAGSGQFNTRGSYNVFMGRNSGVSNSSGNENVFIGYQSGLNHYKGGRNVFVGTKTGEYSSNSKENVFVGAYAGYQNSLGNENVFIGYQSGYDNQIGQENTFVGSGSGYGNQSGNRNTFFGFYSGLVNTTGNDNTIIGYRAGSFNVSGSNNIFLGLGAGVEITSGNHNVIIGNSGSAYFLGNTSDKFIVHNQVSNTSSPLIYGDFTNGNVAIGSSTILSNYKLFVNGDAYASGIWVSNQNGNTFFRKNSKSTSIKNALDKISSVSGNQQTFQVKTSNQKSIEENRYTLNSEELQRIFPALVKQSEGQTAINYQGLIPVLVEAIKELKEENKVLRQEIKEIVSSLSYKDQSDPETKPLPVGFNLSQNLPNPFTNSTEIAYSIPNGYENGAIIKVVDLNGREVKRFTQLKSGNHIIKIEKETLPSGIYSYSLLINNKVISSKKMVIK